MNVKMLELQTQMTLSEQIYQSYKILADGDFSKFLKTVQSQEDKVAVGKLHIHDFLIMMWTKDNYKTHEERINFLNSIKDADPESHYKLINYLEQMEEISKRSQESAVFIKRSVKKPKYAHKEFLTGIWKPVEKRDDELQYWFSIKNKDKYVQLSWFYDNLDQTKEKQIPRIHDLNRLRDIPILPKNQRVEQISLLESQNAFKEPVTILCSADNDILTLNVSGRKIIYRREI